MNTILLCETLTQVSRYEFGWSDPRGGLMAVAGPWGGAPYISHEIIQKLGKLKDYCEVVGWELVEIHLNKDDIIDDEAVGLLKIASVGDVIDGVCMRVSEEEFYVVRKPKFSVPVHAYGID